MAPQRPTGVAILAILDFLGGELGILGGLVLVVVGGAGVLSSLGYGVFSGLVSVVGGFFMLVGILALAVGWGMWTGKGWAWMLALVLYGLGVLSGIASLAGGSLSSIVGLLIDVLLIWYLFRPNVKAYFGRGAAPAVPSPAQSPSPSTT